MSLKPHDTTSLLACALWMVLLPGLLRAAEPAESIAYLLEDFESYTPGLWRWSGENGGSVAGNADQVHGGQRALALNWDFTTAKGGFLNATFHRRLVGQVQEVRVWVWASEQEAGTPLTLWIGDRSGEITIQRATVDWTGWKQVAFSLVGVAPGWASGDRNSRQDPPLEVFGLAVEVGGPAVGRLLLDDMDIVTLATPREALALTASTAVDRNLFWEQAPVVHLALRNHSRHAVPGSRCTVRVEDLYREREVWSGTVDFSEILAGDGSERNVELPLPYGVYRVRWRLADGVGDLLDGSLDVSRLLPPCYADLPAARQSYERRRSLWGGVFGVIPPSLASATGARWIRYENTVWSDYEKEPGRFDLQSLAVGLQPYQDAGIDAIILQTLYQRPPFRNPDQPDFAPAYGDIMRRTAAATPGLARCFELGNEDNGPTKMLYSEVARHGAAGIRAVQAAAQIANSGTAFVDLGWLEMQERRGVMDGLDVLCTHPYTVNESPEAWSILERLGQVDSLIDRLGGMKAQWTTEFGWHHEFSQPRRAEWIPRHFLIGAAAGLERHGLYTWERDYGIFLGVALPAAASVHALVKTLEGHRFVGLLQHDNDLWAEVWQRGRTSLAVAWSPAGKAEWSVDVGADSRTLDLFGNPLQTAAPEGRLTLTLDGGPVYVTHITEAVREQAVRNRAEQEQTRFATCLKAAQLPAGNVWEQVLNANTPASTPALLARDLSAALTQWTPASTPIKPGEQAVVAQALRWYDAVGREARPAGDGALRQRLPAQRLALGEKLVKLIAEDVDAPSLRYLLERWDRLLDEERADQESGTAEADTNSLLAMQATLAAVCERFAEQGERGLYAMWPYLYTVAGDGTLQETLRFLPGESTSVKVRVNNYSRREREVTVHVQAPAGWACQPPTLALRVPPGGAAGEVRLSCPLEATAEKPVLECVLQTAGLPERRLSFDDVVVEAPVRLTVEPVRGRVPQTPLRVTLTSLSAQPLSGLLRLLRQGDTRALARASFEGLTAAAPNVLELSIKQVLPYLRNEWPLTAQFILADGRRVERPVALDFACAVRAATPPTLDGDLADWAAATPLHLDREEYGKGSFGGKWSPEDLSATVYAQWDNEALYVAVDVRDQTFNQTLSGTSQWIQDSIQLAVARDPQSARTEIGLALTPRGEEVVSYSAPAPEMPGSRLKVKLRQGGATYEAAIPWSALTGLEKPEPGSTLRFAVLVNDDDAVTGRRFLERYGGIAHDKDIATFGFLTLLPPESSETRVAAPDEALLTEDFEEYDDGARPDAWDAVWHQLPIPEGKVVAGAGRGGSKGLVLVNTTGRKPFVYLSFVRPLPEVRPGASYELRGWVRGRGVEANSGIIGVCSDRWGNEAFTYAETGAVTEAWREVVMPFPGPPGGRLNVILRNDVKMEELVIDDLRITVAPR
jgi:hypothetical protein